MQSASDANGYQIEQLTKFASKYGYQTQIV